MARRRPRRLSAAPPGPRVVAITGGIGAGKSTLCALLAEDPRIVCLSADAEVRALLERDGAVQAALAERFGAEVRLASGGVDRARLAARVFGDRAALGELEALLHPLVRRALAARVAALQQAGAAGIVLVEIPLLVENGVPAWCDRVVTVEAPRAVRLARLERKGLSRADAERRMARQAASRARRAIADHVVENGGDRARLERAARRLKARWES